MIARYNGTGAAAVQYGEEVYGFYAAFEYYNLLARGV